MWWIGLFAGLAGAIECAEHADGRLIPAASFQFAPRTADLVESEAAVASVHCALARDGGLTVQVEVHTDPRGSGSYNLRISQERADAIRAALLAAGVAEERVTAVGYGETLPVATGYSPEEMAQNRRIELHTGPPSSRPPRPEGAAPPAPLPQPKPAPAADPWCVALQAALAAGSGASWVRPEELRAASERMRSCLNSGWESGLDGDALYATHPAWRLAVERGPDGTVVRLEPRE